MHSEKLHQLSNKLLVLALQAKRTRANQTPPLPLTPHHTPWDCRHETRACEESSRLNQSQRGGSRRRGECGADLSIDHTRRTNCLRHLSLPAPSQDGAARLQKSPSRLRPNALL